MTPADKAREIAESVWKECERQRGSYHPNDRLFYVESFAKALIESAQEKDFWREECGKLKEALIGVAECRGVGIAGQDAEEALCAHEARCREKMGEKNDGT